MTKVFVLLVAIALTVLAFAGTHQVSAQQCTQSGLFCVGSCNYIFCEGNAQVDGLRPVAPGTVCVQEGNTIRLEFDVNNVCPMLICPRDRYACVNESTFLNCDPLNSQVLQPCPPGTVCRGTGGEQQSPCVNP